MDDTSSSGASRDLRMYVVSIFKERFPGDIRSADSAYLWGEAFLNIRVTSVTPEMKALAKAIELEFDELGIEISVHVSDQWQIQSRWLSSLRRAFRRRCPEMRKALLGVSHSGAGISRNRSSGRWRCTAGR